MLAPSLLPVAVPLSLLQTGPLRRTGDCSSEETVHAEKPRGTRADSRNDQGVTFFDAVVETTGQTPSF